MQESDDYFSAAQLAALDRRGISAERVSWRRITTATLHPVTLRDDPDLPAPVAYRRPKCPIVDRNETGKLIILPDGEEQWVQI